MHKLLCLTVLITLGLHSAFAQDVGVKNLKVGFVNIRKLMIQAPQIVKIQEILNKDFEQENKAISALASELEKLNQDYKDTKVDNQLFQLQKEISIKQRELIRLRDALQDEYSVRRNEELGSLQSLIVKTVTEVSKEKKLDLVLNNTGVIYINSRIDITPDVMAKLMGK